jgi:serine/threonine protein phosphatase 1
VWLEHLAAKAVAPWRRGHRPARPRLTLDAVDVVYAVGDVHGCLDQLVELEDLLLADASAIGAAAPVVVMLGDYVDRGPRSADVLDHLIRQPDGFERLCLLGNHEVYFVDFIKGDMDARAWCALGGAETLWSYGIDPASILSAGLSRRRKRQIIDSHVPDDHRAFLERLPVTVSTPAWIFVHAGLKSGVPLAEQQDDDLVTTRDALVADYTDVGRTIVHGHIVTPEPVITKTRISLDTGAYLTGKLSAVRLYEGTPPKIISSRTQVAAGNPLNR